MPESNWNSKLHWNNPSQRFTTKWTRKKRSLNRSTISGNHRQFYKTKLGLNHLNNKELKERLKKQMREMLQHTTGNRRIAEKNESKDSSPSNENQKDFVNPLLTRSHSPPVKTRLLMSRKNPRPWTIQRRALLSKKAYNNQTGRLRGKTSKK